MNTFDRVNRLLQHYGYPPFVGHERINGACVVDPRKMYWNNGRGLHRVFDRLDKRVEIRTRCSGPGCSCNMDYTYGMATCRSDATVGLRLARHEGHAGFTSPNYFWLGAEAE